jgi:uncharacterized protein YbjT (DUF2867 family)
LVTGATGQQGGATARELLAAGHKVRAMTRKPESDAAGALAEAGAEVVQGDLDHADSLKRALAGMWGVYAVQNTWEAGVEQEEVQGKRIAELAKEAGVRHFVYASVGAADKDTGIPHFDNKFRVEQTVRGLGFPSYVIVRPVFFMENFLSPWFKPAIDEGNGAIGIQPDTVLQMIAVADVGKYGKLAFERHAELNGRAIDIAGDGMTMPRAADVISKAAGREVKFVQVPIEDVRKFSEDFALMFEWFDRVGYDVDVAGNAKEYGIEPTSFADWAGSVSWGDK